MTMLSLSAQAGILSLLGSTVLLGFTVFKIPNIGGITPYDLRTLLAHRPTKAFVDIDMDAVFGLKPDQ